MTLSFKGMQQLSKALQKAIRYQQSGQFSEAELICLKICAAIPDQPDTLHLLAVIYAQTQRYQLANDFFQKAIAKAPTRADFIGNYANTLLRQNQIETAIGYCEQSLALNSNQAEVLNILGSAYLVRNQNEIAAECFHQALQLRPQYPLALNNLGNALQKMNNATEAIPYYQKALEFQDGYAEASNNLGRALKSLGRIDKAEACFRRALEWMPGFKQARQNLAEVDSNWLEPLKGRKLYLRRYEEQDAAYINHCHQNDTFMRQYNQYISHNLPTTELAAKLRQAQMQHPCQTKSVDWIIFHTNSEQPAGIANLVDINFLHRRAEFLIGLPNPDDHARGIALEATLLILEYTFNRIQLNKLTTIIYATNPYAHATTLALGFVQESHFREHLFNPIDEQFLDIYVNGMTQSDFRSNTRIAKLSRRLLGRDITATQPDNPIQLLPPIY
ncbi:MAG: GNAT family N-acetyltransferase [Nitrosomonas sp.]|uniref:GNAT family N-acetyltransferase n=1 Tax=Nitrosomonas sp. TaxID=42353 RepID=UPI0032ECD2BC